MRYTRVTAHVATTDGYVERKLLLQVTTDSDDWLIGAVINREGSPVVKKGAAELAVLHKPNDIVHQEEMKMNLHYGELEPVASDG